jgi:hypothetical protein
LLRRVVWQKFTDISEVFAASIMTILMMEAARTSKTSVNFHQTTRRNNLEVSIFILAAARTSYLTQIMACFKVR